MEKEKCTLEKDRTVSSNSFSCNSSLSKKNTRNLKLLAVSCAILIGAGDNFSFTASQILKSSLKKDLNINNSSYEASQSSGYLLSTIMPFLSGLLMDKFGIEYGCILSSSFILLGNIITLFVPLFKSYKALVLGKLITGFGSGANDVCTKALLAYWYDGPELASMLGIGLVSVNFFSFLASLITFPLKNIFGYYGSVLVVGVILSFIGWGSTIAYFIGLKQYKTNNIEDITINEKNQIESEEIKEFRISHLLQFPNSYWFLPLIEFFLEGAWAPMIDSLTEFVSVKYDYSEIVASRYSGIVLLVGIIFSYPIGKLVDISNHKCLLVIVSNVMMLTSILVLAHTDINPSLGISLSSFSILITPMCLISIIPTLVKKRYIGSAVGLFISIASAGDSIFDVLSGILQDMDNGGYSKVLVLWIALTSLSMLFTIIYLGYSKILETKGARNLSIKKNIKKKCSCFKYIFMSFSFSLILLAWAVYMASLVYYSYKNR